MKFTETRLAGAFLIAIEPVTDERGFFARSWAREEFAARGLNTNIAQCSISYNRKRGTLRGLHYQTKPYEEAKLVSCITGAIYEVILDLRRDSATYRNWIALNFNASDLQLLYIPEGFAHGFQTLEDNTQIFYQISESYHPECAGGIRWDDPAFAIDWPVAERIMSERDKSFPDFIP